jgi:hypothetical protein
MTGKGQQLKIGVDFGFLVGNLFLTLLRGVKKKPVPNTQGIINLIA